MVSFVSKAFTKEDEDAGFDGPAPSARVSDTRLTAYGARILRAKLAELEAGGGAGESAPLAEARIRALLETSEVLPAALGERVALGARVRFRDGAGRQREVAIVTPEEVGPVPNGTSAASPLARALLGARVGDVVEHESPRGAEELVVVELLWP